MTPAEVSREDPETGETVQVGQVGIFAPREEVIYRAVSFGRSLRLGYAETIGISRLILGFLGDLVKGGVSPREGGASEPK